MKNLSNADPKRELLRHGLATLAYRGGKAIRNAPAAFADFSPSEGVRSPGKILAHIGDLLDWGLSIAAGKRTWKDSKPLPWEKESERFFEALKRFDEYLESSESLHATPEKLLQGPVADALTHVGQIAMLRRMAGGPVRGESYFEAEVIVGRVGDEQTRPKREF
jgi:hypothetical protein